MIQYRSPGLWASLVSESYRRARPAGGAAQRACSAGAHYRRAGRAAGRWAPRAARVLRRYYYVLAGRRPLPACRPRGGPPGPPRGARALQVYHVLVSICIQPRGEPPGPGRRLVPRAEGPGGAKALRAPTFGSPGAASFPTLSAREVFSCGVVGQVRPGRRGRARWSPLCRRCLGRCWPTRPLFACPMLARAPRESQWASDLLTR